MHGLDRTSCDSLLHFEMVLRKNERSKCVRVRVSGVTGRRSESHGITERPWRKII